MNEILLVIVKLPSYSISRTLEDWFGFPWHGCGSSLGLKRGTESSQFWISGWADGVTDPWKGTGQENLCDYSVAYGSIYIYIYIYIYCVCV